MKSLIHKQEVMLAWNVCHIKLYKQKRFEGNHFIKYAKHKCDRRNSEKKITKLPKPKGAQRKGKKKVKQIIAKAVAKWKLYAVAVAVVVVSAGAESIALEREKLLCCAMNNAENLQIFKERFFSSQLRLRSLTCVCKYVCHLNVIKSIFA